MLNCGKRLDRDRGRSRNETCQDGPEIILTVERWQFKDAVLFFVPLFLDRFWKQVQRRGPCRQVGLGYCGSQ